MYITKVLPWCRYMLILNHKRLMFLLIHTLKSLLVSLSELLGGLILSSGSNQVLLRTWLFVGSLGLRFLTPRVMFKEVVEVQRNDSRWLKICILLLSCNVFNTKLCVRIMIWVLIHSTIDFIHNFLLYPTALSWFCKYFGYLPFQFFFS